MSSGKYKIDNKSYDHLLITQDMIDDNRKAPDEKMKKYYSKLDKQGYKLDNITAMINQMMYHNQNSNYPPDNMDSPQAQCPTTVVPDNNKTIPLEGGNYTKNGYLWTLKHEISSPKFYELLINTELKATLLWTSRTSTTT